MAPIISPYFTLSLSQSHSTINITMRVKSTEVTTSEMPYTLAILEKELPTILQSRCFNEGNVPFYKEVLSTELGHLFEHILLEYLCISKIGMGFEEAMFSGITKWDWNKEPYGTFHIELDMNEEDVLFLTPALKKAKVLFEKILLYPAKPAFTLNHKTEPSFSLLK